MGVQSCRFRQTGGGMKLSLVCSVILVAVCLVDNTSYVVLSPEPFKVPLQREPLCLSDDGEELCKKSQQRASLIRSNYVAAKFANEVKNSVCYLHNAPDTDACASGWEQNEGRCFYCSRGETIKSYAAGETKCKSRHPSAHLASIHSKQEHDFILERLELKGHGTYIGGSDKELEGHWVWSDGSPWDYEYWSPKNPSNGYGKGEHCAMMWHDGLGRWNDAACDNIHQGGYVCSYDLRGRGATGYRIKTKIPALINH